MGAITSISNPAPSEVKFKTPDGVERNLVWRLGSERLIVDWLGCNAGQALIKYDAAALPDLLYAAMYDDDMNPPKDLTRGRLAATLDIDEKVDLMATFLSVVMKGRSTKNELAVGIRKAMESQVTVTDIGSALGASLDSASDSPAANSGHSPNGSSVNSKNDTESSEESNATASA